MTQIHTSDRVRMEAGNGNGHRLVDLLRTLRDETTLLLRQEFALARAEMAEKGKRVSRNVVYLAIGGAIAYAALLFVLLAITFGVMVGLTAAGVPLSISSWLSPLIVGVVFGAIGYAFVQKGISTLKRESPTPERTVQSLQENKEWLKHKLA